ncbi:MAG TPA: gliding motility-associated C-terminal domain-containing protein [Puia sp.]|jgi:gliding motility-associated-like protein
MRLLNFFPILTYWILCLLPYAVAAQGSPPLDVRASRAAGIHFLANNGQLQSVEKAGAMSEVLFKVAASGGDLYVTTSGLSYVFYRLKNRAAPRPTEMAGPHQPYHPPKRLPGPGDDLHFEVERVDLRFNNAHILKGNILTTASLPTTHYRNLSADGKLMEMPLFDKIVIREIYPGIDWVLFIDDNQGRPRVKQDFVLRPGADTRNLVFTYSGNARLKPDSGGGLSVTSRLGHISEQGLEVQESADKRTVPVKLVLDRNSFTYRFAQHQISRETTIDPVLYWGTALSSEIMAGANTFEHIVGNDVETDKQGNIFVLLTVDKGVSFPTLNPGNGAYYQDLAATPGGGMVIMKFTPGGVLLWSTFYSNPGVVGGVGMAIDPSGNVYVAGSTDRQNVLMEFSAGGALLWTAPWGIYPFSQRRLACDSKGNLYITGIAQWATLSIVDPGGGAYKQHQPYLLRPFISMFSPAHQLVWSTQLDGRDEYGGDARLAIDANDNVYLVNDSVRCFDVNHTQIWKDATVGEPYLRDVAVDRQGEVFVTGYGPGAIPTTDPGGGAFTDNTTGTGGLSTGFILKYSAAHQLVWSTSFFNETMTDVYRIVADQRCDAVHLIGFMNYRDYLVPTLNTSCVGGFYFDPTQLMQTFSPVFVTFSTSGRRLYTSLSNFPYNYYDDNLSVVGDPTGNLIYLFGNIFSYSPMPAVKDPGNGAFVQTGTNNLYQSAFLMKLQPSPMDATLSVTPPTDCSCNGSAGLTMNCGTPPYSFLWSNGETTQTVTDLCSGKYTVTVSDENCNQKIFSFTVAPAPGSITNFTASAQTDYCKKNNGTITVSSVTGGAAPYGYSIDRQTAQATGDFNGLKPGNHFVLVTDVNGCFYSDSVLVPETRGPDSIYATTSAASCVATDGTIRIDGIRSGSPGYEYSMDGQAFRGATFFPLLTAGDHQVQVRDAAGCLYTQTLNVLQSKPASGANVAVTADYCGQADGTVLVGSVVGGTSPYAYSLTRVGAASAGAFGSDERFPSLVSGDYTLDIRDSKDCELKIPVGIKAIGGPSRIVLTVVDALCGAPYGALKEIKVTNGTAPFSYSLDGVNFVPDAAFPSLPPSGYQAWVKDSAGCLLSDSFYIISSLATKITVSPVDTGVCYGEKIVFNAVTGDGPPIIDYTWNAAASTNSGVGAVPAFTYTAKETGPVVLVTHSKNGCSSTDTVQVTVNYCDVAGGPCIHLPTAFSPNDDGKNDGFGAVAHCPVSGFRLVIYDRWGEEVFATVDIDKKWNGMINGAPQPAGMYVFSCEYSIGGEKKVQKGTVMLVR